MKTPKNKSNFFYNPPEMDRLRLFSFPYSDLYTDNGSPFYLLDNYGRVVNYLRLSVTDRCNLRCLYCMPEEGLSLTSREELLTWEEMITLCGIFIHLGIKKIRITGGEPFVRKGLMDFLCQLKYGYPHLEIGITTNGVLVGDYLNDLDGVGIRRLNFSVDTLQEETFKRVTKKSHLEKVLLNLDLAYAKGFTIKINMVVLPGINDREIPEFVEWTKERDVTIRFIEPMPFDTFGGRFSTSISGGEILNIIQTNFEIIPLDSITGRVAQLYRVRGYKGKIGIINGYSRSFCEECSRIRVSSYGEMYTCLYGKAVINLREMLRDGISEKDVMRAIVERVKNRNRDGFESADERTQDNFDSMSMIGG